MSDLTQVLLAAQHETDETIRQNALNQLKALETSNFANYIGILGQELINDEKPDASRRLAGILLKNCLNARSTTEQNILNARWNQQDEKMKFGVRQLLLKTLANKSKPVTSTAALAISKLAAIDYPQNKWPDLVPLIVAGVHQSDNQNLKTSSFETLGYICEEVPRHLGAQSSQILNAIARGMSKEETNNEVKLAATTALANSLNFAKANFEAAEERNLIMQMIFSATQCDDVRVRTAAFRCLVEIASSYYDKLPSYIQMIFGLTQNAIEKDRDEVSSQAIEFWSTICDQEISIHSDHEQANEQEWPEDDRKLLRNCSEFIKVAMPNLLPLLFLSLTKQSEDPDDETWTAAAAAGACLGLCAEVTKNDIVKPVLAFVQANIENPNWRLKEAAILSFGCILDGPEDETLTAPVTQAMGLILAQMKDDHPLVKDTAAWTVGRICNLHPECVLGVFDPLMKGLMAALADTPKVASTACWAIYNLADSVQPDKGTSRLSSYFQGLLHALFSTADRQDSNESNLISSSYEAINMLIQTAAPDVFSVISMVLPELIQRLNQTNERRGPVGSDRDKISEIQSLLCGSLQVIIQHPQLPDSLIAQYVDTMMALFLSVLESKGSSVNEEALFAIGAVADRVGKHFEKYVGHFKPFLLRGLSSVEEVNVCIVSVDLVGELTRALEERFFQHMADEVMRILLDHLQNSVVDKLVKPHILSCLGDIALAVGGLFDRYSPFVLKFLAGAASYVVQDTDDDIDYVMELKRSILEGYTGVLQGLAADNKQSKFVFWNGENVNGLEPLLAFLDKVAEDESNMRETLRPQQEEILGDAIIRAAAGLIGDMGSKLPRDIVQLTLLKRPSVRTIIDIGLADENEETLKNAQWAANLLQAAAK